MRRLVLPALAVLVAAGGVVTSDAGRAAVAAEPGACTSVLFIGLRGSGQTAAESGGLGREVAAVRDGLADALGRLDIPMTTIAVDYTAAPVSHLLEFDAFGWMTGIYPYFDSIEDGILKLQDIFTSRTDPTECWVVSGYSQGALAAHHASSYYSSDPRMAALLLVADPDRDPASANLGTAGPGEGIYPLVDGSSTATAPALLPLTLNLCNSHDVVCDPDLADLAGGAAAGLAIHTGYTAESLRALGASAAGPVAAALGVRRSPQGLDVTPAASGRLAATLTWSAPLDGPVPDGYEVVTYPSTGTHYLPASARDFVADPLIAGAVAFAVYSRSGGRRVGLASTWLNMTAAGGHAAPAEALPDTITGVLELTADRDWILADTTIEPGGVLRAGPGVHIRGLAYGTAAGVLRVNGTLELIGTAADPVRLTSTNGTDPRQFFPGTEREAMVGDYAGIRVGAGASVTIDHADIGFARTALDYDNLGATGSTTEITNSVIHDVSGAVLMSEPNELAIAHTRLLGANSFACLSWSGQYCGSSARGQAVVVATGSGAGPTFVDVQVVDASYGIHLRGETRAVLDGVSLERVGGMLGAPIMLAGSASGSVVRGTTVVNSPAVIVVSGALAGGQTTWAGDLTYRASGVSVPVGGQLVIPAGAQVTATGGYRAGIEVLGALAVLGTAAQPVRFSSGSTGVPAIGDWAGFTVGPGAGVRIEHADITQAAVALDYDALAGAGSTTTVSDTVIHDVGAAVVMNQPGTFQMTGSVLANAGSSYCQDLWGQHCWSVADHGPALTFGGGAWQPVVTDTTITDTYRYAVRLRDGVRALLDGVRLERVGPAVAASVEMEASASASVLRGTTLVAAQPVIAVSGALPPGQTTWAADLTYRPSGVSVPVGSVLVVPAGAQVTPTGGYRAGIEVLGSLAVLGTAAQPVRFSSGSTGVPAIGDWAGFTVGPGAGVRIEHADITQAAVALDYDALAGAGSTTTVSDTVIHDVGAAVVMNQPGTFQMTGSVLANAGSSYCRDLWGGFCWSATQPGPALTFGGGAWQPLLADVAISDTSTAVEARGPVDVQAHGLRLTRVLRGITALPGARVDASAGWWGDPSGPAPAGAGAAVSGAVIASPWCLDEACAALSPADTAAPVVTGTALTTPHSGWYRGDLTVRWTVSDPLPSAGIASLPGPPGDTVVTGEGAAVELVSPSVCDLAGHCGTGTFGPVAVDATPPSIVVGVSGTPDASGWYTHAPEVSAHCTDALSGVGGCSAPLTLADGADQSASLTATDVAGNVATAGVEHLQVDTTPPLLVGAPVTVAGASGWYRDDVVLRWTCVDEVSGIAAPGCPADVVLTGEGASLVATAQVSDVAGLVTTASSEAVGIDRSAPTTSVDLTASPGAVGVVLTGLDGLSGVASTTWSLDGSAAVEGTELTIEGDGPHTLVVVSTDVAGNAQEPLTLEVAVDGAGPQVDHETNVLPNAAGWLREPVTITFACLDTGSGVAQCPVPVTVATEGAGQVVSVVAADLVGNATVHTLTVSIDATPPAMVAALTGSPNALGWFRTPVPVSWSCTDGLSGVATCPAPIVLDGSAGDVEQVVATDVAGNVATAAVPTVRVDATPPTVSVLGPADGARYLPGREPVARCAASDIGSGLVRPCTATVQRMPVLGGTRVVVTASAADRAGNSAADTATYLVPSIRLVGLPGGARWDGAFTTVPAGTGVRLSFAALAGGAVVTDPAVITSISAARVSCTAPTGPALSTTTLPRSGLVTVSRGFERVWVTPDSPRSCYRIAVTAVGGSLLVALVRLG